MRYDIFTVGWVVKAVMGSVSTVPWGKMTLFPKGAQPASFGGYKQVGSWAAIGKSDEVELKDQGKQDAQGCESEVGSCLRSGMDIEGYSRVVMRGRRGQESESRRCCFGFRWNLSVVQKSSPHC